MDCSCLMRVTLFGVLLLVIPTTEPVNGQFVLTVNFINYTNPTGLCAECETGLESVTSADQLVPVCCDESAFTSVNCDNTGEARCDTRFRWTIRPFGASLETRPATVPNAEGVSPYYFTDCNLHNSTCPFSEMSTTFSQGPTGFLGVAANPLPVVPRTKLNMPWTGSVQFFIEALDSGLPNIIDSLLINLDTLQLGADFTEEMTFTGYHNISHMTMSFRVACKNGSCGRDCTTTSLNNPRIQSCNTSGEVVCTDSRYDPFNDCNSCLHNLDISTDCSTCIFDSDTNCTACLPRYDIITNCSMCPNTDYDPSTNCTMCLDSRFDPDSDCTSCLLGGYDPLTNCTQCLPNRDPSTDCSTCLFGFDVSRNCSVCLPGRDISTNCTTCLSGYAGENCVPPVGIEEAHVGGIVGGVSGSLLLVIIVLVVIVSVLVCQVRRSGHAKLNISADKGINNPIYGKEDELDSKPESTPQAHDEQPVYDEAHLPPPTVLVYNEAHLPPPTVSVYDEAHLPPPTVSVYDEAHFPPPTVSAPEIRQQPEFGAAYERIDDNLNIMSNGTTSSSPYDKAHHTPSPPKHYPSANVYSKLEEPPSMYSALEANAYPKLEEPLGVYSAPEEPSNVYSAIGEPTKTYSRLNHPATSNSMFEGSGSSRSGTDYSTLNGALTEEDLSTYDVTSHHHPQTQPQTLPAHQAALYDTANYPNEPSQQHHYDFDDAADFMGLPTDSSLPSSVKPHPYDYVDTPLDGEEGSNSVPPAVDPQVMPVYTNTVPGKITSEAESHYDLGL